ncbi:ATP-grasp domain-containing protein [Anaerotardibacter muris]|uniref:ATP-grasp domain-containing protein n=1 Tax=Anaerotardibacter muris TaxID=2941505 RepID=UPI0020405FA6|nr:hypothetical protein [Anaerotardibacter muris]
MIGILYESNEWSDWKLGDELRALLDPEEVRMIDMEEPDALQQAAKCDLLISRVFASAAFRGHDRSHAAMDALIALVDEQGIELINPGRAHAFEIDKRLATETLGEAGLSVPAIIASGTPEALLSSHVFDAWPYPCIIKPNCGGRTTHTAVLHSVEEAAEFLNNAPALEFIVENYLVAKGGFLTRIEVVDGAIVLVVKRSVAANGLSSYHEGSTYELYPECPQEVVDEVIKAADILGIQFGSFDVIEAQQGNFIIDANSVSNVSEDCTELFHLDLMAQYAQAIARRHRARAVQAKAVQAN